MSAIEIDIDIQIAVSDIDAQTYHVPTEAQFKKWIDLALKQDIRLTHNKPFELTIRVVDAQESQTLNADYRDKQKPTNVLSFCSEVPDFVANMEETHYLGDLIICAEVVCDEAKEQNKLTTNHWAHMSIHGVLHLLGYDHINDEDAKQMESLERIALQKLGIDDPYIDHTNYP